ncbi:MAG: 50S ribosomal protein L4 [Christensenellales bacterium]
MPKVSLYNIEGQVVGDIELSDTVFGAAINEVAVHTVVRATLANRRSGTQSALTRAEVSGGGIKPWRQKGTGHARQGSTRSPQWRKGGVVFAPKPRSYKIDVNKKVKRLAMMSVLSAKVNDGELIVLDSLELSAPKTKEMAKVLANLDAAKALVILDGVSDTVKRASDNIEDVKVIPTNNINVYDLLKYNKLIMTQAAVKTVEGVYAL